MIYNNKPQFHFTTKKGWINDPNGLVYFNGYYHIFYQHCPNFEVPWKEPVHWGHAITKDFITWEELSIALYPDKPYDNGGCWSGTAIVKDDMLYLFYASIYTPEGTDEKIQTVSVAYSKDGISFEKYENNPVINTYPTDGCPDFRDPAVAYINGKYYCVMASGNYDAKKARLLLYESGDLLNWKYKGIMSEWDNSKYTECPSVMETDGRCLVAASVLQLDLYHYFRLMYGSFKNGVFKPEIIGEVDKGPDQYAGQVFKDHKGRCILISWIPGWGYEGYAPNDVGCMSVPREIFVKDGRVYGYPVKEVQHLLKNSDDAVRLTTDGFEIDRTGREKVVHKGRVDDIRIIRDEYVLEVFVNGGETVYTVLL